MTDRTTMTRRIEVDFNMYDDDCFVAVTDEPLNLSEVIVAYDVEGHEMTGIVRRVEGDVVYFSELAAPPIAPSGIQRAASGWTIQSTSAIGWAVQSASTRRFSSVQGNRASSSRVAG